jgi:hypothetical protein
MPALDDYQRNFQSLFADGLQPDYADALARAVMQYAHDWFDDHMRARRPLDPNTWLRDITITAIVFMTAHKFKLPHERACKVVADVYNKHNTPLSSETVTTIVQRNAGLVTALKSVVDQ